MALSPSNTRGALYALTAFAVFATHDVVVKSLGASYGAIQIMFFSVLLGFPLLTLMLMQDPTRGNLRPVHPWWMALRTVAVVITGLCAFYAFANLPLAQAYAIFFASPLLITLLSIPILGEKVGLHRGAAVVAGLVGVLIVLRPGDEPLTLGHAAAVVAAVCNAVNSVIMRKIGQDERTVVLLLYPMIVNFVLMAVLLPFIYVPMPIADLGKVGVVAAFGFIAMNFLIFAYRNGEAVIVAPMQYSQIIWATIFGITLFNEIIDMPTMIGAGVIIMSGIYILLRESSGEASENTPVLRTRSRFETGTSLRVGTILRRRGEHPTRHMENDK